MNNLKGRAVAAAATIAISVSGAVFFASSPAQAANTCTVTPKAGVSSVAIRGAKTTSGSPDGYLSAGHYLGANCTSESGGYYSACSSSSSQWFWVDYGLFSRYVAAGCVRLIVDRT